MPVIFWGIAAGLAALGIGAGAGLERSGEGAGDAARATGQGIGDAVKIAAPIAAIGLAFYLSRRGWR